MIGSFTALAHEARELLAQEHRYAHSVRVARLADRLAQRHGADAGRARIAGMLHDLARLWTAQRILAECAKRRMEIDAFEQRNPVVLHARLGAELARERFGVEDGAVLDAIRKHTCAAAGMSMLDTILYLADALEPGRDYPERADFEALAFVDLNSAAIAVIESTLRHLRSRDAEVAPQTLAALAFYKEESAFCPI